MVAPMKSRIPPPPQKKENYVQEYKLRKDFISTFFLNFNHHMVNRYILKNVYPYGYIAEILTKWR